MEIGRYYARTMQYFKDEIFCQHFHHDAGVWSRLIHLNLGQLINEKIHMCSYRVTIDIQIIELGPSMNPKSKKERPHKVTNSSDETHTTQRK